MQSPRIETTGFKNKKSGPVELNLKREREREKEHPDVTMASCLFDSHSLMALWLGKQQTLL